MLYNTFRRGRRRNKKKRIQQTNEQQGRRGGLRVGSGTSLQTDGDDDDDGDDHDRSSGGGAGVPHTRGHQMLSSYEVQESLRCDGESYGNDDRKKRTENYSRSRRRRRRSRAEEKRTTHLSECHWIVSSAPSPAIPSLAPPVTNLCEDTNPPLPNLSIVHYISMGGEGRGGEAYHNSASILTPFGMSRAREGRRWMLLPCREYLSSDAEFSSSLLIFI